MNRALADADAAVDQPLAEPLLEVQPRISLIFLMDFRFPGNWGAALLNADPRRPWF